MNESAPITWLVDKINEIVSSGASSAAGAISTSITPLVSVCFGIYILLITINYMRGAETEPVLDFGMRCASFAIIVGLGLNASNYSSMIIPIVTGLGGDLANAISGGTVSAGTLDQLALFYLKIIGDGFEVASASSGLDSIGIWINVFTKAAIIMLGLIPFLVGATLVIIIANVGSVLVAMVGPIFFGCLLFPATRQYFSAWVNTAFSYALIPVFVAVIATLSVGISKEMLSDGGSLVKAEFATVFLAAIGNLILLFLLKQVAALASSLSAGGINAGMAGGIGSAARAIGQSARGTAKEVKQMYQAGRAIKNLMNNRNNEIKPG